MAKLAIKGHPTRGKEVIEILKMLGGKTHATLCGNLTFRYYYIKSDGFIDYKYHSTSDDIILYSLEEFREKFPYKVGDKVLRKPYVGARQICEMRWDSDDNCIKYGIGVGEWFKVLQLQPYKEETTEETIIDTIKESKDRYRLSINYQYEIEVDEGEYYVVRRKPQYPKTYEECCNILHIEPNRIIEYDDCLGYRDITQYDINLLTQLKCFRRLLICRDAYWKIAGDWEPAWGKPDEMKYCIVNTEGNITKWVQKTTNKILAFPTEEMRDAFFENFKELIKSCKELL